MACAEPRELIARAQQLAAEPLNKRKHLPNAGRQTDTVIIYLTVTRNVVLAPIIGQVRRATYRSTPSYVE